MTKEIEDLAHKMASNHAKVLEKELKEIIEARMLSGCLFFKGEIVLAPIKLSVPPIFENGLTIVYHWPPESMFEEVTND